MSGITWLGHGSFQIDTPAGARVLIDPWLTGNPSWPEGLAVERCDAILLTHGHGDHLAGAVIEGEIALGDGLTAADVVARRVRGEPLAEQL